MPLFLKTVRSVCKFCQQLALEGTKLIKLGTFQELDTLGLYAVSFWLIKCRFSEEKHVVSLSMSHNF